MSVDQEKRRQDLRDEVRKRVEARAESTPSFNMQDMVFGMLIDMIADLQARVDELERGLSAEQEVEGVTGGGHGSREPDSAGKGARATVAPTTRCQGSDKTR